MTANNKLERTWKEVVMSQFEVLSQPLFGGAEKNHQRLQSG
jgi:hypothetical protein